MDTNVDPVADLSSKSDEELGELESDLVAQFDAADEADDLDTMSAVADQIDAVRSEIDSRGGDNAPTDESTEKKFPVDDEEDTVTASADDKTKTDEPVTASVETAEAPVATETPAEAPVETTPDVEAPAETPDPDETAEPVEAEPDTEPEGEQPADTTTPAEPSGEATESTQPEATTAGGDKKEENVDIPDDRAPVTVTASANTILAGTDIPGFAAGTAFGKREDVAVAMEKRLDTIRRTRSGDGEQHVVATIVASAPPERVLEPDDLAGNLAKIEDIIRVEAITAAGGYCAPLETRYDIFGTGTTARPVRDALAGFQARRGGIRYTSAPKITDFADALGLWTAANDANPATDVDGEIVPKAEMTVECQPEQTALIDAVTLQLRFGNLMTRAFPELIDRNNQLALVAHARYAERVLLNKMTALSTSVTSAFKLGTARDFLNAVGRGAAAYRHRYRMEPTQPLRALVPIWVRDAVREDLAMQMPGDNALEIADNVIDRYLRDRNVNPSWHLDGAGFNDEVDATTLDDFPASFDWYLYAEGAFIFLDGGTLDLGVVRDSGLVSTNDYKTFTETFEGVARIGAESLRITTTTRPAGATAGTVNTVA